MKQEIQVDLNVYISNEVEDIENTLKKSINNNQFNLVFMGLNVINGRNIRITLSVDSTISKTTISKELKEVFNLFISKEGIKLDSIELILNEVEIYENY